VTAAAGGVWSVLLGLNLSSTPAVPWSVAVVAALLAGAWRLLGRRAPGLRQQLRANRLLPDILGWALAAGLLAVAALVGLWIVLAQLTAAAPRALPDTAAFPPLTVALVLAMAAILGAVVEEAMFRGYLQGGLEPRVGGPAAIVITCLVMAPEHALTQGFAWTTVAFYLLVDAMLGTMARLTGSIVPGTVVHAVGLFLFFAVVWPGDAGRVPVASGGADAAFWVHGAQAAGCSVLALLAFDRLRHSQR
jgi:membrane protease YdiL (CAAX protease family)